MSTENKTTNNLVNANLFISEATNKKDYEINSEIKFTTIVTNTGNIILNNAQLKNNLNDHLKFITNSITINGKPYIGSLDSPINLGNLNINETITIKYSCICIKSGFNITEQNTVLATYNDTEEKEISKSGNLLIFDIYNANFSITKTIDAKILELKEKVTFTITLINSGELELSNLTIIDDLNDYFKFVNNSIKINNTHYNGNLNDTIKIQSLPIGNLITISFDAICTSINNDAFNDVEVIANYKNKNNNDNVIIKRSNIMNAKIIDKIIPKIDLVISENKTHILPNELLTYNIKITNTGNIDFTNLFLSDILDDKLNFINDSLIINNVPIYTSNIDNIELEDLEINGTINISFKVISTATNANIINFVTLKAQYGANKKELIVNSNKINIRIDERQGNILFTKEVDKVSCKLNDKINYILRFINNGNIDFDYILLKENLSEHFELVKGTTKIDNVIVEDADIIKEIEFQNVKIGDSHRIDFQVIAREAFPKIANTAIMGAYYDDKVLDFTTNEVYIDVIDDNILDGTLELSMNKNEYYKNEEPITSLKFTNTGSSVITKATIKANLPENIKFINNSIQINNSFVPGNITKGIDLYNINPQEIKIVTFKTNLLNKQNDVINTANIEIQNNLETKNISSNQYKFNILDNFMPDILIEQTAINQHLNLFEETEIKLTIRNNGNITLNNIYVIDQLPRGLSFIENSLKYNYESINNDITKGFIIQEMKPNYVDFITFKVIATDSMESLINYANVIFKYTDLNNNEKMNYTLSNQLQFTINGNKEPILELNKTSNKGSYVLNEDATFTLVLNNLGNTVAKDIIIKDILPDEYEIIPNTTKENNVLVDKDIIEGLQIDTLNSGESTTITFNAKAIKVNTNILNIAQAIYSYYDENNKIIYKTITSSENETFIHNQNEKNLTIIKKAKNNTVYVGETIEFQIDTSSDEEYLINLKDELNSEYYDFVLNSLIINNSPSTENIKSGINISSNSTIRFKALAIKVGNDIPNYAIANFNGKEIHSNKIYNTILNNEANLIIEKAVSNNYTFINNKNTFTIKITNIGDADADNITIIDNIDNHYEYVESSIKIDNILIEGNITNGIIINKIKPKETKEISFNVIGKKLGNNIVNIANLNYYSEIEGIRKISYSEPILTDIIEEKSAYLEIEKTQEKETIMNGEENTFTIKITNTGNTLAKDIILTDPLSNNYKLLINSLIINNRSYTEDITKGIILDDLEPNQTVIITFKVLGINNDYNILNQAKVKYSYNDSLNNLNNANDYSNEILTNIIENKKAILTIEKTISKSVVNVGEENNIHLTINNIGNDIATNIKVVDIISNEYQFVSDSLYYNGNKILGNINEGITINNINPLDNAEISFSIKALNEKENIINTAKLIFNNNTIYSNEISSDIISNKEAELTITKSINHKNVLENDIVKYELNITNNSEVDAKNIVIEDIIPINLKFKEGSLYINNNVTNEKPDNILINEIKINEQIIITFEAIAIIPGINIENHFNISYDYQDNNNNFISKSKCSNKTTLNIYEMIDGNIEVLQTVEKTTLNLWDSNKFTYTIKNTGNVTITNIKFNNYITNNYALDNYQIITNENIELNTSPTIKIDTLEPNEEKTIILNTTAILSDSDILNISNITFNYKDMIGNNYSGATNSNKIFTNILDNKTASIFINKLTSNITKVNNIIDVSLEIQNIGNTIATDINLKEILAKEFQYITDSLYIDNVISNEDILKGIKLDNLDVNKTINIKYKIKAILPSI